MGLEPFAKAVEEISLDVKGLKAVSKKEVPLVTIPGSGFGK